MATKTDNSDPRAKLELRRHFLCKYHGDNPPHVLDCCQGEGVLWRQLRQEFSLASYWGVDVKKKKGRLKLDSVRILQQPGWPQDVVDVDTYGSPWKHWEALLPNTVRPTTVFLTIGLVRVGGGGVLDRTAREALGLSKLQIPPGISGRLHDIALPYLLTMSCHYGIMLVEVVEAVSTGNARYIGVRLQPGEKQAIDDEVPVSKQISGTKEWSVESVNILLGCAHKCRYCYARANAVRRKQIPNSQAWGESYYTLREKEVRRPRKNAGGTVMFPSTHDILPEFL